ncbi:Aldo/keto reductase [Dentipellis sp. KUC8613]|nr:Aldo/keto reductase [Dentipellis sp. KUC8613]
MAPKIIYGTAWKKERTTSLVVSAVLNGFRAIDTAAQLKHYREDLVGEALSILYEQHGIKREDLYLQTKYTSIGGQDKNLPLPYNPSDPIKEQLLSSFNTSLKNLRTTYLDGYVLHSPLHTYAQTLEARRTLAALQDEGKIRRIGLSNVYDEALLQRLGEETGRPVQIVQDRWYEGNGWDAPVVEWCNRNGVQFQGFWTLTGSPVLLQHPTVATLAQETSCTPAQILYRFAQLLGITPLSGTTNETHMQEDVCVEEIKLSLDDFKELTELIKSWQYTRRPL